MSILVIDIGSSSVRALLFDEKIEPIPGAAVRRPHQFTLEPPGAATLDMTDLQARTEACLDEILQHPAAKHIRVVGMATLVGNLVGLDEKGDACTPIYTYADTRSANDVETLKHEINSRIFHYRTGCMLHSAYHPGRLRWLHRTEPVLFAHVTIWTDLGTSLYRQWFGEAASSYSVASWSGLFNRHECTWDNDWLQLLHLDKTRFSPLADYIETCQGLIEPYASRWPALRDVPFCLPVGDGAAANVGSGCIDKTRIALTIGTTAAMRMVSSENVEIPYGLWAYRVDSDHHLVGGATSEGGSIFRWVTETFALERFSDLEPQLWQRQPDAHGLTFLPLLAGERSPGWATDATGAIAGLRLSTEPIDVLQAALEGVALRLALIAEVLLPLAAPDAEFIASGGALVSSPAWGQITANAINRPLHLTDNAEVTARGVALLAAQVIGDYALAAFPPQIIRTFEPQSAAVIALRRARTRQVELYNKLIAENHHDA